MKFGLIRTMATAVLALGIFQLDACEIKPDDQGDAEFVTDTGFPTDKGANTFAWSMEEFNGKVYIGTAREIRCVEFATAAAYKKGIYTMMPEPDVNCTFKRDDLPLRSQIWEYNPATKGYRMAWQAPEVKSEGRTLSKYMGVRGMTKLNGVLYANTFTTGDYDAKLVEEHPPSLLRTTDGQTWEEIPNPITKVATVYDDQDLVVGFRSPAVVNGRLFVTAAVGLLGDGVVVEIINPASDNPTWIQVSPKDVLAYEIEAFNNQLYVGIGDLKNGYSVLRWDLNYTSEMVPVITNGGGRGSSMASVVSMDVYRDHLYVGSSGWETTSLVNAALDPPQAELIRVKGDNTWEVVVGNARTVDGQKREPVSGIGDGFGNKYNAHIWRGIEYNGAYYVGTNDWSWLYRDVFLLDNMIRDEMGFDMFYTCDGVNFEKVTDGAFADGEYNFGLRSLAVVGDEMLIGSANYIEGAKVWSYQRNDCG